MAGPSGPSVDMDRVVRAKMPTGPYRVVPGDILQLQMPAVLSSQMPEGTVTADGRVTYNCRVYDDGTIVLPVVGRLAVAGQSLADIENAIIAEYHPKYVATLPPIHVTVLQHKTHRVSIMGSVVRPGIYTLRHDQTSLVALLMEAGGVAERGAAVIESRVAMMRQSAPTRHGSHGHASCSTRKDR
jgi:protein involved in polysaccharide export with SLBB domain